MKTAKSQTMTLTSVKGNQFPRPMIPTCSEEFRVHLQQRWNRRLHRRWNISIDYSGKYGAADLADCCQRIRDLLPLHKGGTKNPPWIRFGALESDRDRDDKRCQQYCAVPIYGKVKGHSAMGDQNQ